MPTSPDFSALFRAIDAKDADGFAAQLADDAVFVYGSQPPVQGRGAIRDYVAAFFGSLTGIEHHLGEVHRAGAEVTIVEGRVTYRRDGEPPVTIPFANVLRQRGDEPFHDYRIYIDPTPLGP
jgi:uncharacterized protein (TIGR02246 family)